MENKNQNFEFGQVMLMLENMNDGIKLLAEGQSGLAERMDTLEEKFDLMADDMDCVKSDIIDIKRDIVDIKRELKMKADNDVVADHETRLVVLENSVLASA